MITNNADILSDEEEIALEEIFASVHEVANLFFDTLESKLHQKIPDNLHVEPQFIKFTSTINSYSRDENHKNIFDFYNAFITYVIQVSLTTALLRRKLEAELTKQISNLSDIKDRLMMNAISIIEQTPKALLGYIFRTAAGKNIFLYLLIDSPSDALSQKLIQAFISQQENLSKEFNHALYLLTEEEAFNKQSFSFGLDDLKEIKTAGNENFVDKLQVKLDDECLFFLEKVPILISVSIKQKLSQEIISKALSLNLSDSKFQEAFKIIFYSPINLKSIIPCDMLDTSTDIAKACAPIIVLNKMKASYPFSSHVFGSHYDEKEVYYALLAHMIGKIGIKPSSKDFLFTYQPFKYFINSLHSNVPCFLNNQLIDSIILIHSAKEIINGIDLILRLNRMETLGFFFGFIANESHLAITPFLKHQRFDDAAVLIGLYQDLHSHGFSPQKQEDIDYVKIFLFQLNYLKDTGLGVTDENYTIKLNDFKQSLIELGKAPNRLLGPLPFKDLDYLNSFLIDNFITTLILLTDDGHYSKKHFRKIPYDIHSLKVLSLNIINKLGATQKQVEQIEKCFPIDITPIVSESIQKEEPILQKKSSNKKKKKKNRNKSKSSELNKAFELSDNEEMLKESRDDKSPTASPQIKSISETNAVSFFKGSPLSSLENNVPSRTSYDINLLPPIIIKFINAINELHTEKLILIGDVVTKILLGQSLETVNDFDFVIFNVDLDILFQFITENFIDALRSTSISGTIQGKKHVVLALKLTDESGKTYDIDINTLKINALSTLKSLRTYLADADLTTSQNYIDTSSTPFVVTNMDDYLTPVSTPTDIEIVSDDIAYYQKNPINVFRIIKQMIKYPELPLGKNALESLNFIKTEENNPFPKMLISQADEDRTSRGQISTALAQLFSRFSALDVLEKLNEVSLLKTLFRISDENIDDLMERDVSFIHQTADVNKRTAFFYILYTYQAYEYGNQNFFAYPLCNLMTCVPKEDKEGYRYIANKLFSTNTKGKANINFSFEGLDEFLETLQKRHVCETQYTPGLS